MLRKNKSKRHIQLLEEHEAEIKYVYKHIPEVAAKVPVKEIKKIEAYEWVKKLEPNQKTHTDKKTV